jgi:hypothetical protein
MIDTENQFEFVTRQFASFFLGISASQFDKVVTEKTPIEFKRAGRDRRFKFSDLARLMFPDATDRDIQQMRVMANMMFAGIKRGRITGELGKEKTTKQKTR